jgi:hypothetical protein
MYNNIEDVTYQIVYGATHICVRFDLASCVVAAGQTGALLSRVADPAQCCCLGAAPRQKRRANWHCGLERTRLLPLRRPSCKSCHTSLVKRNTKILR